MSNDSNEVKRFPTARSVRVEELIDIYDGIIPEVDKLLHEKAISDTRPIPTAPDGLENILEYAENGDPIEPEDLTIFSSEDTGKLYSYFTSWANYTEAETSRAQSALKVLERNVAVVKAALEIYYKEDMGLAANVADNRVTIDRRYVDIDSARYKAEVYYLKVKSVHSAMKRTCNTISREQTRRAEEMNRENKNADSRTKDSGWTRGSKPKFRTRGR